MEKPANSEVTVVRIHEAQGLRNALFGRSTSTVDETKTLTFDASLIQESGNDTRKRYQAVEGTFDVVLTETASDCWQPFEDDSVVFHLGCGIEGKLKLELREKVHTGFSFLSSPIDLFSRGINTTQKQQAQVWYDLSSPDVRKDQELGSMWKGRLLLSSHIATLEKKLSEQKLERREQDFHLKVTIRDLLNFSLPPGAKSESHVWLSYEVLGVVVQTDLFCPSAADVKFPAREDKFQFQGTLDEFVSSFEDSTTGVLFKIYMCTNNSILGIFEVIAPSVIGPGKATQCQEKIDVFSEMRLPNSRDGTRDQISPVGPCVPKLHLSIDFRSESPQLNANSGKDVVERYTHKLRSNTHTFLDTGKVQSILPDGDAIALLESEEQIYDAAKQITRAQSQLDKRQKDWDVFRRKEEDSFRRHLRKKEEGARRFLEEQVKRNEDQHMKSLEVCRNEYKKLETRLKKALSEVESKERQMRRVHDENAAMYTMKLAELELREKMLQEETEHSIEMGATKLRSTLDHVQGLESEVDRLNKKVQDGERELECLRQQYQGTGDGKMVQQVADLQLSLIEMKSQFEREREKKIEITADKDHYRLAAHRLAKMVRRERSHHVKPVQCDGQNPSENKQSIELDRIQKELSLLLDPASDRRNR